MAPATLRAVSSLIGRQQDLRSLHIDWFGEEPLDAWEVVETLLSDISTLREGPGSDLQFSSAMITRGLRLDPDRLHRLVKLGNSRFQIPLAGFPAAGSGEILANHLLAAQRSELEFEVILLLPPGVELTGALGPLRAQLAGDHRFRIHRSPAAPAEAAAERPSGPLASLSPWPEARDAVASLGLTLVPRSPAPGHCFAASADSLVIRADGGIAKCTAALQQASNRVGRLREDGTLELDWSRWATWTRGLSSGDVEELSCPRRVLSRTPTLRWRTSD